MLIGSTVTSSPISLNIVPLMPLQDALRITKFIGAYPTSCPHTRNSADGTQWHELMMVCWVSKKRPVLGSIVIDTRVQVPLKVPLKGNNSIRPPREQR